MAELKSTGRVIKIVLLNEIEILTDNRLIGAEKAGFIVNPSDLGQEKTLLVIPSSAVAYIETVYEAEEEVNEIFKAPVTG